MDIAHSTKLIFEKLERWATTFIRMLPNLLLAIIVIVAGYFIAKFIRRMSYRITLRISKSDSVSSVVSIILQTIAVFFAFTIALNILNLDKAVATLLAGVGIIGLALGFAFQDLSANFISGLFMAFRRPFEIGDQVETNGFIGTIQEIELRSTTLTTTAGLNVIIPNKDIFQKPIINYSRTGNRRIELDFTLMSTTDLAFGESLVCAAVARMNDPTVREVEFYYTGIEDPKIKLTVSFRIDSGEPKHFMTQRHKAIMAIYKTFAEHNIVKVTVPENKPQANSIRQYGS